MNLANYPSSTRDAHTQIARNWTGKGLPESTHMQKPYAISRKNMEEHKSIDRGTVPWSLIRGRRARGTGSWGSGERLCDGRRNDQALAAMLWYRRGGFAGGRADDGVREQCGVRCVGVVACGTARGGVARFSTTRAGCAGVWAGTQSIDVDRYWWLRFVVAYHVVAAAVITHKSTVYYTSSTISFCQKKTFILVANIIRMFNWKLKDSNPFEKFS
jgi:hypothetical protein